MGCEPEAPSKGEQEKISEIDLLALSRNIL